MGFYVEVMCDERKDGHAPDDILTHKCWSHRNVNPQGHSIATARKEAKRLKWVIRGDYACCPGCRT